MPWTATTVLERVTIVINPRLNYGTCVIDSHNVFPHQDKSVKGVVRLASVVLNFSYFLDSRRRGYGVEI